MTPTQISRIKISINKLQRVIIDEENRPADAVAYLSNRYWNSGRLSAAHNIAAWRKIMVHTERHGALSKDALQRILYHLPKYGNKSDFVGYAIANQWLVAE